MAIRRVGKLLRGLCGRQSARQTIALTDRAIDQRKLALPALVSLVASFLVPTNEARAQQLEAPKQHLPLPGEITFGVGASEDDVEASFDTLFPLYAPKDALLFLNPKITAGDDLDPRVSIGIGFRKLFPDQKVIVGANVFYDSYDTENDHRINQLGLGVEVLTRWVDFRGNFYLPEQNHHKIDDRQTKDISRNVTSSSQDLGPKISSSTLAYQGNNLLAINQGVNQRLTTLNIRDTETTSFWERYEAGMRGGDVEIGFLIPGLDKYVETRVFGGYYYFNNDFGRDIEGFKGRLEVRALPAVTFDAMYYQDEEVIGSNWFFGMRVSGTFDLANLASGKNPFDGWADSFKPKPDQDEKERFSARMTENVMRTSRVSMTQSKFIKVAEKKQTYKGSANYVTTTPFSSTTLLTLAGAPITITHVSSAAAGTGNGTFETPYSTLTLANADAVKRNIVLAYADSVFNGQTITLTAGQQFFGEANGITHQVNTDQLGTVTLPRASLGTNAPIINNPGGPAIIVSNNVTVSGVNLNGGDRGIYAPTGASNVTITNSTISNMTTAGIEIVPSDSTTIDNVVFDSNGSDVILNAFNTTLKNITSNNAQNGAFKLSNTTGTTTISNVTVNNAKVFAIQFNNPGGTHSISGLKITGSAASGLGVDIEGGGGTFAFDSTSFVTNTGGAAFTINSGTSTVVYGGNLTQSNNSPLVAVLNGHTGTATFMGGTLAATNGQGLLFDNADGTYNFLGTTTLSGGSPNISILNGSGGTFGFGAGTSVVNPTGQGLFVNGGTSSVTYAGSISKNTSGAAVEVLDHSTGSISFTAASSITATNGTGLQFTNDSGTYNFLGTTSLNGGDAGVDILNSNGTFNFDIGTTITNPSGTGFFVNGGQANVTYLGNINDNSGFALQVINHSVGTIAFGTGTVTSTGGLGVQFTGDSGIYSIAKLNVTNSTGAALEVTNSPTGTFTFGNLVVSGGASAGVNLNNAGTVSLLGGSINGTAGDGVFSQNTKLTLANMTLGNTAAIGGIGVNVLNNDGTARLVTISNNNIRSNGSGIVTTDNGTAGGLALVLDGNTIETLTAGSKAMNITGSGLDSTTVRSLNGGTVIGNGTGGGLEFNRVTFDGDSVTAGNQTVSAGAWNIGQGTGARVFNDGLRLSAPTGNLAFTTLNIYNNAGTGLFVDTATLGTTFGLGNTGGVINTTNGAALNLDPLTTNLTFASVTSTNSGTSGIIIDSLTAGSSLTIGTTSVSNSTGDGIVIIGSAGSTLNFGTTTVTNSGGDGIDLTQAGNANVTFGATTINGFSTTGVGINFAGADVTAHFGVTSIQNGGNGTGIDLSSTQNGRVIDFATGSSITNVAVGVQLSSSGTTATSANANFTFGDGSGVDANGRNSTINAPTTVAAIGLGAASGSYNFQDVFFTGSSLFPAAPGGALFVSATAVNGAGDGSFTNPYSVADADAINTSGSTFAFLDGTYNFATLNGGTAFTLASGQALAGLDNGRSFGYGTIQPVNISGDFGMLGGTVTRANTGNGTLSITNGAAAGVFDLGGSNNVSDITLTGEGGAIDPTALFTSSTASNAGGITITGVTIGNLQAGGSAFAFTGATGSIQISNNNINTTAGTLLNINGGSANYTLDKGTGTLTGAAISVVNTTGGSVQVTGAALATNGNTAVTLSGNAATTTFTNVGITRTAGDTAYNIDATTASTGKVLVNGTSSIDSTAGRAFQIGAGARDIDASAMNFTNAGTAAGSVISSTGQTGGTISFGNVGITGYSVAGGTAVSLAGTGGSVVFGDLDVTTTNGSALSATGISLTTATGSTLSATNGRALTLSNVAATLAFDSLSSTGSTTGGVAISGTTGSLTVTGNTTLTNGSIGQDALSITNSAATFNFQGTTTISGSNQEGIALSGANGAVTFGLIDINGTAGRGVEITGATNNVTFNGGNIGGTTVPTGFAVAIANQAATSTIAFNNVSTTASGADNFNLSNNSGTFTVVGGTHTQNGTGNVLDVESLPATGVVNFGGTIVHNGNAAASSAVEIDSSAGIINVTGTVTAAGGAQTVKIGSTGAITNGAITFSGAVNQTGGTGISIAQVNNPASVSFTAPVTLTNPLTAGVTLNGNTGAVTFANLGITTSAAAGLVATNQTGLLTVTTGSINATGGPAVNASNVNSAMTFTSLSSTGSATGGVAITNMTGLFTVTGNTTLINGTAGQDALGITNSAATFNFQGTTTISGLNQEGIALSGANGAVTFGSISINGTAGRGVEITGATNNVTFNGGNIGGATVPTGFAVMIANQAATSTIAFNNVSTTASGADNFNLTNNSGTLTVVGGTHTQNGTGNVLDVESLPATGVVNFGGTIVHNGNAAAASAVEIDSSAGLINVTGSVTAASGAQTVNIGGSSAITGGVISFTGAINQTGGAGLSINNVVLGSVLFSNTVTTTGTTNSAITISNVAGGSVNFSNIALSNILSGPGINLNSNAGGISFLAGTINQVVNGNGITAANSNLLVGGLSIGNNTSFAVNGRGIEVTLTGANTRTIGINSTTIRSTLEAFRSTDSATGTLNLALNGNAYETTTGVKTISVTGSGLNTTIVRSLIGGTVTGNNTGGGVAFNRVTFDSDSGTAGNQQVAAGNWNIGLSAAQRVAGDGLRFDAPTGDLLFGTLSIFNNAGTGLFVDTKTLGTTFALGNTGGSVNTAGGTALNLDPLTTNLTFASVTSTNSGGTNPGVIFDAVSGSVTIGTLTVTNAGGAGLVAQNSSGTFTFTNIAINGAGSDGIRLANNTGTFATVAGGATTINNVVGDGIDLTGLTLNPTVNMLGTVGITRFGGIGVNFTGANVTAAFGVTTINNVANGGVGTAIDLSSTTGTRNITFAAGSAISNVAVGVQIGATSGTAANANFVFGDGTSANGLQSSISATTTVAALGLDPAPNSPGVYNFNDVNLTGAVLFQAAPGNSFFVSATAANGAGDGSFANPYSVADANAITGAATFAFLDGTYNFVTLGTNGFSLAANQSITGLDNGNSIAYGVVQPNRVLGNFGTLGGLVTRANTGNGTLSITNGTVGGSNVFTLSGSNGLSNITITGEAGANDPTAIIFANGGSGGFNNAAGITLTGVTIGNVQSGATALSLAAMTGTVLAQDNNLNASGGSLLNVTAGTGTISVIKGTGTLTGRSIIVTATTGGSVQVTGATLTTVGNTAVTLNGNAATTTFTNLAITRTAGDTAFNIDATTPSTGAVTINGTSSLDSTAGRAFVIGAGGRNINASGLNFSNVGTAAGSVISSTGQTGGTISFGNVGITGYNVAGGTAVNLQGTGGSVLFGDLDIAALAGAGLNLGAITFSGGASPTISTVGGSALVANGTTWSGGAATFTSITETGGANAISLTNVTGTANFAAIALSGTSSDAVLLNNAGTVNLRSGSINGVTGHAINATNSNLSVGTDTQVKIGNTGAITGDGIRYTVNDAVSHTLDVFDSPISNVAGQGINVSHSGNGTVTFNLSSNAVSATGNAVNIVKSGAGNLNFAMATSSLGSSAGTALNVNGSAGAGILTVTTLNDSFITTAATGGAIFNTVVFDANTTTAGIQTVNSIGLGITATGAGLSFTNTTGALSLGSLNIANTGGTGLSVNSALALSSTSGSIATTNGTALNLTNATLGLVFTGVSSTNAITDGIIIGAGTTGSINLGNVTVTGATGAGINLAGSGANVTTGTITVTNAATGLRFGANTGTFTATGATSLTGITGTGINANAATGSYTFQGLTINFSGAGRGIDLRGSNVNFETNNLVIAGNGTAGSIGLDLSGSLNPNGANSATANIKLAKDAGETAAISAVATGVKLGEPFVSAGANLRYGNQTPIASGGSGSSIAVIAGGVTIDTSSLVSTTVLIQGHYEFTGVAFTGQASFEGTDPNFIFVGTNAAGSANGSNPNNRISTTAFLASFNTAASLTGKTVVFVNDNAAGIDLAGTTLNLGANTTLAGFGNGASITVAGGIQPVNVIGDNFAAGGGTFNDGNIGAGLTGAATVKNNAGSTLTLSTGNTLSNFILGNGGTSISGTTFGTLTVNGMVINNTTGGAVSLTTGTLAGTGFTSVTTSSNTATGISLNTVGGTMNFGTGAISNKTATSFSVTGNSTGLFSYAGSLTNAAGRSVSLTTNSGGSVTLSGNINDTGTGILIQSNIGGAYTFSGTTKTLSTGTNQAVTVASNTGATIDFSNGGLAITTTTGVGFGATGGGTVSVTGTGNTISTGASTAALGLNGIIVGTNGVTFQSISATGAANGITLTNLTGGGAVGVKVSGVGSTAGSGGVIQNTTGAAVQLTALAGLTTGVTLNNMTIGSNQVGISGTNFGTLNVTGTSVTAATNALVLATGTVGTGSVFSAINSSAGGISLTTVNGSFTVNGGTLNGAVGAIPVFVSGGNVSMTFSGNINQAADAAVFVQNGHTGTLTFNTGTLNLTGGTGLQFTNADGTYNFNGTTTMNGGDAGVDIVNGSDGTFTFGAGTTITNPAGPAFLVSGGTASVTYNGSMIQNNNAALVSVDGGHITGTLAFTGSLTAGGGTGLQFDNADGTYNFTGTTTLSGGNAGIDILNGSGGTFTFGVNTSITNPSGTAFVFNGSTANVTYSGNMTKSLTSAGLLVDITSQTSGTITFQTGLLSSTSSAGTGISLTNVAGTVNFNGTTTLNGGDAGVDVLNGGPTGNITFGTGASITNPSGIALSVNGGANTVTYNGTLSKNSAGLLVEIQSRAGGAVTVGGNLSATGTSGGLSVHNNISANTVTFSGANKTLTTGANTAVLLLTNTGATINFTNGGLAITTTSGDGFTASGGGTINVTGTGNTVSTTTGTGVGFVNTTIGASGVTFDSVSTNGAGAGIGLDNVGAGNFTANGGSIVGATLRGVDINLGSGNFTYNGSISTSGGGARSVEITGHTAGTVAFGGNITDTSTGLSLASNTGGTYNFTGASKVFTTTTNTGVSLATNTGATINFTGGGLVITTTSGTGFSATGGATAVNVTGTGNTITSPTGTALNVVNTTIGASGLTFQSISSASSSGSAGIILDNTGSLGGLTVTGTGTVGSGGTIANKTGGDILTGTDAGGQTTSGTNGTGIFLRNTLNPSFTRMQLNNFSNFGIYGNTVTGFTLANSVINGANGDNNAGNREEASIRFDNLLGTASISNSTVAGGAWGNIAMFNTSGTLNRLTLDTNTFGLISTTIGNDNVNLQVFNTATANITATGNTFLGTRSDFFEAIANNNATMDVVARNNDFQNGQAIIPGGGVGVSVRGDTVGGAATITFDISHNILNHGGANAFDTVGIFVAKGNGNGTMTGTIMANNVGPAKAGANADGIFVRSAGGGTTTVLIKDNVITGWGNVGIHLQNNDGSSTMNASVFGNSVTAPGTTTPFAAFFADNGATATDTSKMNLVLGSSVAGEAAKQNTFVGGPNAAVDVSLSNFNGATTFNLSRNGSAGGTSTVIVQDDNVGSPTVDTTGGAGTIIFVNTLPTLPPVVAP